MVTAIIFSIFGWLKQSFSQFFDGCSNHFPHFWMVKAVIFPIFWWLKQSFSMARISTNLPLSAQFLSHRTQQCAGELWRIFLPWTGRSTYVSWNRGTPQFSSISRWDFPWKKPSSELGVALFRETPISMNISMYIQIYLSTYLSICVSVKNIHTGDKIYM